jgi:hypothetical protein
MRQPKQPFSEVNLSSESSGLSRIMRLKRRTRMHPTSGARRIGRRPPLSAICFVYRLFAERSAPVSGVWNFGRIPDSDLVVPDLISADPPD